MIAVQDRELLDITDDNYTVTLNVEEAKELLALLPSVIPKMEASERQAKIERAEELRRVIAINQAELAKLEG